MSQARYHGTNAGNSEHDEDWIAGPIHGRHHKWKGGRKEIHMSTCPQGRPEPNHALGSATFPTIP